MIFYFSGTGNSRWIAQEIARVQEERLLFIPEEESGNPGLIYRLGENEKIGFVFPVHSWAPPPIVLDFIDRLVLENYANHYLFFVCSCGDDAGLTHRVLCRATARKGWRCKAGFSVIMPNTYVAMKGFDVDPESVRDRKLAEADSAVEGVNRALSERRNEFRCKKGKFAFIKTRWIAPLFTRYGVTAKPFRTTDRCTGCGKCVAACPVGNVRITGKPVWDNRCTGCLACYHACPVHAIQYGRVTENKGQYRNPNIYPGEKTREPGGKDRSTKKG